MWLLLALFPFIILTARISFQKGVKLTESLEHQVFSKCGQHFKTQKSYEVNVPKCAAHVKVGDYLFEHKETNRKVIPASLFGFDISEVVVTHEYTSKDIAGCPFTIVATFYPSRDRSGTITSRRYNDPTEKTYSKY